MAGKPTDERGEQGAQVDPESTAANAMSGSPRDGSANDKESESSCCGAVSQAEQRYRNIVRSLPMGMHIYQLDDDDHLVLVDANPAADRITGITTSELFGKTIEEAFPPLVQTNVPARYRLAADKGVAWQTVELAYDDDQISGAFDVYAFQTSPRRMAAVFLDITARKRSEMALRESEERLRAVFEGATNVSFIITDTADPEPRIVEFSPGSEHLFGYERDDVVGKGIGVIHLPEDVAFYPGIHRRMREGETGFSGEMTLVSKDGERFPALFRTYPLCDEDGDMYAALCVSVDIREQRRLESFLVQAQKNEAIGTLASGIAHDFNNMLGAIIGHSELAHLGVQPNSEVAKNLEQVLSAANRAKDLVGQILAFSRRSELDLQPVQLEPLVNEAMTLLRATVPATVEMNTRLEEGAGTVLADATQIHQVLVNLCTNAAHAMRSGGVLTVDLANCELDKDSAIRVPGARPGAYVKLSVTDNGKGIEPVDLARIFEPYFTTKQKGVGTGLGLAIVRGIVEGCGGSIAVRSEVGVGTTFDLYFPRLAAREISKPDSLRTLARGSERVLVVDDEPTLATVLSSMLERLGYSVESCTNSSEALRRFSSRPDRFDLVITDQTMPQMTGVSLSKEILRIRPDMPIILCTGYSEQLSESTVYRTGIRRFLLKPLMLGPLADTVRRVLDGD